MIVKVYCKKCYFGKKFAHGTAEFKVEDEGMAVFGLGAPTGRMLYYILCTKKKNEGLSLNVSDKAIECKYFEPKVNLWRFIIHILKRSKNEKMS